VVVVTTSGVRQRVRVHARGHQAGDVRHVDHQVRAHRVRDLAEALEVEHARIRREAGDDHLRFLGQCLRGQRFVVDLAGVGTDAVLHRAEDLAGEIDLGAVCQVATVIEAHAEDRVARVDQREVGRGVRLAARVRLHVRVVRAEQLLGAVDGQLLGDVDEFAAAVVTLARITFRVLVREHRALRFEHARAGIVLRGDQLDVIFLALALAVDGGIQLGIETTHGHRSTEHVMGLGRVARGARIIGGGGWRRSAPGRESRENLRTTANPDQPGPDSLFQEPLDHP
jgi:hypothetical protein